MEGVEEYMEEVQVLKIIFGIFLSVGGVVLLLLSYLLEYKYLIQEKRCTANVKGIVKKYTLATRGGEHSGIFLPVVFYQINGKNYKVVGPEFSSYRITTITAPNSKNEMEYHISNDILYVKYNINSLISVRENPMKKIYPIGTMIDVFYDPNNPRLSYVLRYCNRKWAFWVMFIGGISVLLIDTLILVLL